MESNVKYLLFLLTMGLVVAVSSSCRSTSSDNSNVKQINLSSSGEKWSCLGTEPFWNANVGSKEIAMPLSTFLHENSIRKVDG